MLQYIKARIVNLSWAAFHAQIAREHERKGEEFEAEHHASEAEYYWHETRIR